MEEAALRKLIRASLGLAFLATFTLASTTNAAPILDFSQSTPANTVTSTGTNLSTTGTVTTVGALAGVQAPPNTLFIETFNFTSAAAPTGTDGNQTQGGYNGTFSYVNQATGVLQVAGTVTGATLSTVTNGTGGTTGNFNASNVTFTTIAAPILQTAFGGATPALNTLVGNFSLTLNNLTPATTTSLAFTGRAAGIITATQAVPEPGSVVMASMALVAGLGGLGVRRFKASRA